MFRRSLPGLCALLATCLVVVGAGPLAAQTPTRQITFQTALETFFVGHTALVTVAEIGAAGASSNLRIDLFDDHDVRVGTAVGVLGRAAPVRLELVVPASSTSSQRRQLRASVTLTQPDGNGSIPTFTFEELDINDLRAIPKISCGKPQHSQDPVFDCPGAVITDLILGS